MFKFLYVCPKYNKNFKSVLEQVLQFRVLVVVNVVVRLLYFTVLYCDGDFVRIDVSGAGFHIMFYFLLFMIKNICNHQHSQNVDHYRPEQPATIGYPRYCLGITDYFPQDVEDSVDVGVYRLPHR